MKSIDYMPRSGIGRLCLTLPAIVHKGFLFPCSYQDVRSFVCLEMSTLTGADGTVEWLWFAFPWHCGYWAVQVFTKHLISSFENILLSSIAHFQTGLFGFLMFRFFFPADWLVWIPIPCQMYNWQSFYFHILWMPFPWLAVSLTIQRLFWIHEFPFVNCWSYFL